MFQTDFETLQSPSQNSKGSSHIKHHKKIIEISPKSMSLRLNYSSTGSRYSFKTPKLINKKFQFEHHMHGHNRNKPLEKTFHNPILPGNKSLNEDRYLKFPDIKASNDQPKGTYLKYSRYPIIVQNRHKYLSILDNFHLSTNL